MTSTLRKTARSSRYKVPNLERGLRIIELLLEHPKGLQQSEIAAFLHCAKTSVYRIVMTLVEYGYLDRDEETKSIRLSRKLVAMGSRTLADQDLMTVSVDVLKELRDVVRETVLIGALVETEFVVLGQVLGSHPFKFSLDVGARLPLHTAAPAKAVMAWLPETERERLMARISWVRFNARTLTSVQAFRQELVEVAAQGYALDRGEQLAGIHCVAAPVFNRHGYPIAAVWTTGPIERLAEADLPGAGRLLREHASKISGRLGHGAFSGGRDGSKLTTGDQLE